MENIDKGLTIPKMSADKSAKNTPNAPKLICSNYLPKPKNLVCHEKRLHWESVVSVPRLLDQTRIS